jgi:Uma2 family endonuclease
MNAVLKTELLTEEEYLAGEAVSQVRHEYLGGVVYAMAGATENHNFLSQNISSGLRSHLRGGPCRVFIVDMRARLDTKIPPNYYYPDVMVACDPRDKNPIFKQFPKIIVEVLSEATERIDRGEKFSNYIQIPTLEEYVLVAQDYMEVTVFARARNWEPEIVRFSEQLLELRSIQFSMKLGEVYEGVQVGT